MVIYDRPCRIGDGESFLCACYKVKFNVINGVPSCHKIFDYTMVRDEHVF